MRPPPNAVTVLLPVWGYRFVSQFLEFCLPTLLAPGNIPAIAAALPCRFVLLSSADDAAVVRMHPRWQALQRHCRAEIQFIDDLITDGNHSATITLAFARAVRESGESMLDTCFLFPMSDYVFADGALRNVVDRIRVGASGVVAGNYQVVAEDAIPLLRRRLDPEAESLVLPARELIGWSLAHLHPATAANIVNFGLSHNRHVNRLFWRVDASTLIGRFYLMHMIGIRPEVEDFVVGASCDYSFIPEMCPSGNVVAMTDSDDYLVVEMQPRDHESSNLLPGPLQVRELAESLSEWTTADHRRNVEHTLVYHAAEIPSELPQVVAEADGFVAGVRGLLTAKPQPHRHHHYWIGSLAVNRARSRRPLGRKDWEFLLGETMPSGGLAGLFWRLRTRMLGSPPAVTRLHPRWPDYGLPFKTLRHLSSDGRLLLITKRPIAYAQWLTSAANEIETLETERVRELPRQLYSALVGRFACCLLILTEAELDRADDLIARAGPLLAAGGRMIIMVTNERSLDRAAGFGQAFAQRAAGFINPSVWLTDVYYVTASRARWTIYRALNRIARKGDISSWRSPAVLALLGFAAGPLMLASCFCNLASRVSTTAPTGLWSSVFLILRQAPGAKISFPDLALEAVESAPINGPDFNDARRVAAAVARYRFIGGLLNHHCDVAEYGASQLLYARGTLPPFSKFSIYDADSPRIAQLLRNSSPQLPLAAQVHDILSGPLPKRHEAIYSLDTMPTISRTDEDRYVRNLSESLRDDCDILIVGSRSYGTGKAGEHDGASAPGVVGRTADGTSGGIRPVLRTAAELRALFERYFHAVFAFSMIDEVVHIGALPVADYVFALCCHRKTAHESYAARSGPPI